MFHVNIDGKFTPGKVVGPSQLEATSATFGKHIWFFYRGSDVVVEYFDEGQFVFYRNTHN